MKAMEHFHFVGIGGAGMSGIAQVLLEMGSKVTGSDIKESRNTERLKKHGARIMIGHSADNVDEADVVIISSAIPAKNPEVAFARNRKIPILLRAQMLAELCNGKESITIAGTHGKTTTTSMIALLIDKIGLDPTFLIGGELNDIGGNARFGKGDYLVAEADESDGSFLYLNPYIIVLTNIEADHLDYYGDFEKMEEAFLRFADKVPSDGSIIACGDCPGVQRLIARTDNKVITYGLDEKNDFYAGNIVLDSFSSCFDVFNKGELLGPARLSVAGSHNICNVLGAFALGVSLDLDFARMAEILTSFRGVQRRFQVLGEVSEVTIIDDYAHHPTELKVTLKAAKKASESRVVCIFQPHRFSRTKFLGNDFKDAFDCADLTVLTDVYAAGEEPIPGVTGKLLVDAVLQENPRKQVVYLPKKADVLGFLASEVREGDLVLTAGAGDIWTVGEELLNMLKANPVKVGADAIG